MLKYTPWRVVCCFTRLVLYNIFVRACVDVVCGCVCVTIHDSYSVRRRDDLCPHAGRRVAGFHEKQGLTRKSRPWLHRRDRGLRRRSFCFCPLPINTTRTRQNHVSKRRRFCPRRRVRPTESDVCICIISVHCMTYLI